VGTKNGAKISAVKLAVERVFPGIHCEVTGFDVESGVSAQPKSAVETQQGSVNRAKRALEACPGASYGIGLEGGIEPIGERWFESGWVSVVNSSGKVGMGSSGRYEMANHIINEILSNGTELADIVDRLSGKTDVRSSQGMMGMITRGALPRSECYSHGVIFAFAPFVSEPQYWDQQ